MATSNQRGNQGANPGSGNRGGRGFASMDPERQREIASQGGRAAHESGNAHEFDSEEAREAGRKSHAGRGRASERGAASGSGTDAAGDATRAGTSQQHAESGRQGRKNMK